MPLLCVSGSEHHIHGSSLPKEVGLGSLVPSWSVRTQANVKVPENAGKNHAHFGICQTRDKSITVILLERNRYLTSCQCSLEDQLRKGSMPALHHLQIAGHYYLASARGCTGQEVQNGLGGDEQPIARRLL